MKNRIESFFEYRWTVDKNFIIHGVENFENEYENIVEQLDVTHMRALYS
jgi:hypothetical protein